MLVVWLLEQTPGSKALCSPICTSSPEGDFGSPGHPQSWVFSLCLNHNPLSIPCDISCDKINHYISNLYSFIFLPSCYKPVRNVLHVSLCWEYGIVKFLLFCSAWETGNLNTSKVSDPVTVRSKICVLFHQHSLLADMEWSVAYISPTCLPYFWSVRSDRPFRHSAFPLIFLSFKFSAILALRHSVGLVGAQHIRNVLSVQCLLPSASAGKKMFLHMSSTSSTRAMRRGGTCPSGCCSLLPWLWQCPGGAGPAEEQLLAGGCCCSAAHPRASCAASHSPNLPEGGKIPQLCISATGNKPRMGNQPALFCCWFFFFFSKYINFLQNCVWSPTC